jgi:leader peptidase (prepilin peptidase)/N-methyltransferase
LLIAAVWGVLYFQHGLAVETLTLASLTGVLLYLAMTDLRTTWFPGMVLLAALPLALALFPFTSLGQQWGLGEAYLRTVAGAGLGFGVMLVVYLASRGGLGGGDITLATVLGATLGFPQIIAGLLVGFVLGGAVGIALLLLRLKGRKDVMPFGPALIGATLALLLVGPSIYGWYLDLFF